MKKWKKIVLIVVGAGVGGVSSQLQWEGGKIIHLGKEAFNLQKKIAQQFVSDVFGNPLGWLLDIIMEKKYA